MKSVNQDGKRCHGHVFFLAVGKTIDSSSLAWNTIVLLEMNIMLLDNSQSQDSIITAVFHISNKLPHESLHHGWIQFTNTATMSNQANK